MKLVVLGAGNELKSDDYIGSYAVEILKEKIKRKNLKFFDGKSNPETYVKKIANENPDTVLILDAIEMGAKPGKVEIIKPDQIEPSIMSTHSLSLKVLIYYLKKNTNAKIKIIGIQPKNTGFGEGISKEVEKSVIKIKKIIEKHF